MDEALNPNVATPPAAPAAVVKKPRKPRTPKVKPPKKERVLLGGIVLGTEQPFAGTFKALIIQPPADIANDVVKVTRWAAGQEALSKETGKIFMYRKYNATLKVTSTVKLDADIEFIKEVPQNPETV